MENGFDPVYYANNNKDVVAVIGNDPQQLYLHYTLFGKNEEERAVRLTVHRIRIRHPIHHLLRRGHISMDLTRRSINV